MRVARGPNETLYETRPDLLVGQLEIFARDLSALYAREKVRTRELAESVDELRRARLNFARGYALLVEGNDPDTHLHLDRTLRWARALTRRMAVAHLEELELGFLLHDVGKWSVPQHILLKPGPLNDDEWRVMRTHPVAGAQMVAEVVPPRALDVIRCHHERWDGAGYPRGLAGTDIPVGARVFSVVDVFDALTSHRPYRAELSFDEAMDIVRSGRGSQFDPDAVDAFCELIHDLTGTA